MPTSTASWHQNGTPSATGVASHIVEHAEHTYLTLSEAADVSDKSRATLRRYLDAGRFPNAKRDPHDINKQWLIPVEDLEASGVSLHRMSEANAIGGTTSPLALRVAVAEAVARERADALDRIGALAEQNGQLAQALIAQADAVTALLARTTIPED